MAIFKWLSGLFNNEEEIERPTNVIREPISVLRVVRVKPAESHDEPVTPTKPAESRNRSTEPYDSLLINPATGLPMQGGTNGFDVLGNPFGMDLNEDDDTIPGLDPHHDPFDHH